MDRFEHIINLAIKEDVGDGDHTSLACINANITGSAKLLVKETGIIAGIEIAQKVFRTIDNKLVMEVYLRDGTKIQKGDVAFKVTGKVHSILQAERLVLNIMQRMSGIATQTNIYTEKIAGLKTKILDTRKTTPGFRIFEKMAVKIGGGDNHRMGLYDMIMIKDNHVDFAGGIVNAIEATHKYLAEKKKFLKIEIEVRNFEELNQVLEHGDVDIIMLDNFSVEDTGKAVKIINGRFKTESSGGINLDTIRSYAECGVDYISIGALTHQIKSLDLSLKAI